MIHRSLSEKVWSADAALARLCLCESGEAWADDVTDAALKHAGRALSGQEPDPAALGGQWKRWSEPIASVGAKLPLAVTGRVHPLVWVRWALDRADARVANRLLRTVCEWQCAQMAQGNLVVMRGQTKRSKPSLRRYGAKTGHGWPVDVFLLANRDDIDLPEAWELKSYAINDVRGEGESKTSSPPQLLKSVGSSPARRSRGKGVEFAVDVALSTFFRDKNDMQRLDGATTESRPQYRVDNITRQELVTLLRSRGGSLKDLSDSTVIAELSRWVKFPRGKPAHR